MLRYATVKIAREAIEVSLLFYDLPSTGKTTPIHNFYFLQSISFSGQNEKKKRNKNWLDSWLIHG